MDGLCQGLSTVLKTNQIIITLQLELILNKPSPPYNYLFFLMLTILNIVYLLAHMLPIYLTNPTPSCNGVSS